MAVPAIGAIVLAMMLYFLPSIARTLVSPMIPAFAVEYCNCAIVIFRSNLKISAYIGLTEVPIYQRGSTKEQERKVDIRMPTCELVVTMRP